MQDDLDDGVKWLVDQGKVDPKRVCIMGASYGGYAAMWAAVRKERGSHADRDEPALQTLTLALSLEGEGTGFFKEAHDCAHSFFFEG